MVDRRSLRKINLLKNKPNPIPETEGKGGVGDRDINTGKRRAELENGGTYQASELFASSVKKGVQVQLNSQTKTADYLSSEPNKTKTEAIPKKRRSPKLATGVPSPEFEETTDPTQNNPDNPYFGNCGVCGGQQSVAINCGSGAATVSFSDGSSESITAPAVMDYAAKVKFNYAGGGSGELTTNTCGNVEVIDDTEDLGEPLDTSLYGSLLYEQKASTVTIAGNSGSDLKGFQIYQKDCAVRIVGVKKEGARILLGTTTCDEIEGVYTQMAPSVCVAIAGQKVCGIDPESLSYECVIQAYQLCKKYRISWVSASSGELFFKESCTQLGYSIATEPETPYKIGAGAGLGALRYDSGIPRTFVVNGSLGSGAYGYFQIYQDTENRCEYSVVGVKLTGEKGAFSGAVLQKEYSVIFTGGCGFEIALGTFLEDAFLRVHDLDGQIIYETGDFIPDSVAGCEYLGGTGTSARFSGDCQSGTVERVPIFEKAVSAAAEGGIGVSGVTCN